MSTAAIIRRTSILLILVVLAVGAVGMAGFWHPNAPDMAMQTYLPAITFPTVIVAGVIDGINPCAFTVLLLFITALLASLKAGEQNIGVARARLVGMGSIYIGAVFLTYLALGVGLLKTLDFFTREHAPARIGALVAIFSCMEVMTTLQENEACPAKITSTRRVIKLTPIRTQKIKTRTVILAAAINERIYGE